MPIYGINSARAICTVYILMFWHILDYNNNLSYLRSFGTYHLTVAALATFCLISGYLLSNKIASNSNELKNFAINFYKSRFLKIYPLYVAAIVAFIITGLYDAKTGVRGVFLLSLYTTPTLPTLWFMAMIFFFYLLLPWILIFSKNTTKFFLISILIWMAIFIYGTLSNQLDQRVLIYLPSFLAGIYLKRFSNSISIKNSYAYLIGVLLLCGTLYISYTFGINYEKDLTSTFFATVSSIIIFLVSTLYLSSLGQNKIIATISDISFISYLFHRPIYEVLKKIYLPVSPDHQFFALFFYFTPLLIVSSLIIKKIYSIVEEKIKNPILKNK